MGLTFRLVTPAIKYLIRMACRVDDAQLSKVPSRGPLLLISNHISFLEVPLFFTHLQPRPVTGLAKAEAWDHPFTGWLFRVWGGIPLRRGEADLAGLRLGLKALRSGRILAVAPEGTRSGHGRLLKAHPGLVTLALRSKAPLMPAVHYGGEKLNANLPRLRRTDFHIIVGNPFFLDSRGENVTRGVRRRMIDEVMYQMSALLPSSYRGYYSDLSAATETYLSFPEGSQSNLPMARLAGERASDAPGGLDQFVESG